MGFRRSLVGIQSPRHRQSRRGNTLRRLWLFLVECCRGPYPPENRESPRWPTSGDWSRVGPLAANETRPRGGASWPIVGPLAALSDLCAAVAASELAALRL